MKGFDATQQARIHTEICARENRAAAKHAASDGAATFSLAATFRAGALAPKPNATRPCDWLVDEAGAAAASARLAALAPRSRRRSGGGGGEDDWRRVLPPSSNGEYGSHVALIGAAAAEAKAAGEQQQQQQQTDLATVGAAAAGGRGKGADGNVAEIWAPDNGRKSSCVTQFASAYTLMLGHSPFSSRGRSGGGGGGGGGDKTGKSG